MNLYEHTIVARQDVSPSQIKNLKEKYSKIISQYLSNNRIDILINNTQGPKSGDVNSLSIQDYQKAFDLLFKNTVFKTMLAIEKMKKK